jgi:hypothetical protein
MRNSATGEKSSEQGRGAEPAFGAERQGFVTVTGSIARHGKVISWTLFCGRTTDCETKLLPDACFLTTMV